MVAQVHTYGYDGLRTSTTTSPGTPGAHAQAWFTQDYTEHDGIREHYLRVGDRLVAKLTYTPPPGGMTMGMGRLRRSGDTSPDLGNLVAEVLLRMLPSRRRSRACADHERRRRPPRGAQVRTVRAAGRREDRWDDRAGGFPSRAAE